MDTDHPDARADGAAPATHVTTGPQAPDNHAPGSHAPGNQAPADEWTAVAVRLVARAQRIRLLLPAAVLLVIAAFNGSTARLAIGIPVVVLYAVLWFATGRSARTWRFQERADDLLIEHGILLHKKLAVPYGRMQYIDIAVGPVERALHIATVQLHTASSETRARIPGLSPDDAQLLRDRLAARGQARMTAL